MTNDPGTYRLLVTLPDVTGEEADEYAGHLERALTSNWTIDAVAGATVTHAPQLWVLMIDGPDWDRSVVKATEQECRQYLVDYARDELHLHLNIDTVVRVLCEAYGYLIDITQHEYPTHPASV